MMNRRQVEVVQRAFYRALSTLQRSSNEHPETVEAQVAQLVISLRLRYKGVEVETACDFSINLSKVGLTETEPEVITFWDRLLKGDE